MQKIAFIDHYDSFSFNVLDWLWQAGIAPQQIEHIYCDDLDKIAYLANANLPTLLGPGPHSPLDATATLKLTRQLLGKVPLFGLCLGHQIMGVIAGGSVVPAANPWHGHVHEITPEADCKSLKGINPTLKAACYNSLVIRFDTPPSEWRVSCKNTDQEVMGLERLIGKPPTWSVQFHPESFNTKDGVEIARNWIKEWS